MLLGPSGVGKSSTALAYLTAALARGERGLILSFDEPTGILMRRPPASAWTSRERWRTVPAGRADRPAEVSPGELAAMVREAVERGGVRVVVIDSLTGYQNAMPASSTCCCRCTNS